MIYALCIVGLLAVVGIAVKMILSNPEKFAQWLQSLTNDNAPDKAMFESPMVSTNFFTKRELAAHKILEAVASDLQLILLAKVRLLDVVETIKNADSKQQRSQNNRIDRQHLDFALLDVKKNTVVLAIEVDDKSHQSKQSQMRDEKKDTALNMAGIPIVRIPAGWFNEDEIVTQIKKALKFEPVEVATV